MTPQLFVGVSLGAGLNKILDEIEILNKFSAKNSDFSDLINLQIKEKIVEKKLEKNLIKLGEIQNSVSIKVKNHYEENPYPRWSVSLLPQKCSFIEEVINNDLQNKTLERLPIKHKYKLYISSLLKDCGFSDLNATFKCSFYKPLISENLIR